MSEKIVSLNKCRLLELPPEVLSAEEATVRMTELHACFNYIEKVDLQNQLVRGLTVLSLTCNNLTEIPYIRDVSSIKELYLSNNSITEITHIECYPLLEVLDLRSNRITVFENIGKKDYLVRLSLSCNKIKAINFKNLNTLPRLKFLGLFNNMIDDTAPLTQLLHRCTPELHHLFIGCNPLCGGSSLSILHLVLEDHPHINTATCVDKQSRLQDNVHWDVIHEVISHCPSIKFVDGYCVV